MRLNAAKRNKPCIHGLRVTVGTIVGLFASGYSSDEILNLSVESLKSNFKVEDKILVLDQAILSVGEHFPSHYYTIKYRWNGVQMAEVERSCLKPLPDGMREVG